jgi:hypothetical protein
MQIGIKNVVKPQKIKTYHIYLYKNEYLDKEAIEWFPQIEIWL